MRFDARAAKLLQPGEHLSIDGCPGLRIEATATRRAWTYRFRSPTDGRMRQTQIGLWPAMSFPSASAQWEILRNARQGGQDPALAKQQDRQARRDADKSATAMRQEQAYTVRRLCDDYLVHHVDRHRKEKGAAEVRRMSTPCWALLRRCRLTSSLDSRPSTFSNRIRASPCKPISNWLAHSRPSCMRCREFRIGLAAAYGTTCQDK